MTPKSFDPTTSREMVGDDRARVIEAKARADADAGRYEPPEASGSTYWARCQDEFATFVYIDQHRRRAARNARKALT